VEKKDKKPTEHRRSSLSGGFVVRKEKKENELRKSNLSVGFRANNDDSEESEKVENSNSEATFEEEETEKKVEPLLHNFGNKWTKTLYGELGAIGGITIPKGNLASLSPPTLGFDFSLSHHGGVNFNSSENNDKWKLSILPFEFSLFDAELLREDHFAVLRSPDGEIGLSFDGENVKYFFSFAKPLHATTFSLELNLDGISSVQVNNELGYLSFLDADEKLLLVFSTPFLKFGKKTITVPFDWNNSTSKLSLNLSDMISFPLSIAFGISTHLPTSNNNSDSVDGVKTEKSSNFSFGFIVGDISESEDDNDDDFDSEEDASTEKSGESESEVDSNYGDNDNDDDIDSAEKVSE